MNSKTPTEADVARKAYELWEAEGRPEGRHVAHWHQAEQNVTEPVIDPIENEPDLPTADAEPEAVAPAESAADEPAEQAPAKPKAARARKPKAPATEAEAAKPKAPRRRKASTPEA